MDWYTLLIYPGQNKQSSDVLELNSTIQVKVLKFDEELSRLSLGIKQLTDNPDKIEESIPTNEKVTGKVISMNDNIVNVIITINLMG